MQQQTQPAMSIGEFQAVDAATSPDALIGYLEVANAHNGLRAAKPALVGPAGRAVGVDASHYQQLLGGPATRLRASGTLPEDQLDRWWTQLGRAGTAASRTARAAPPGSPRALHTFDPTCRFRSPRYPDAGRA